MAQEINLGRVVGPNDVSAATTTPLLGVLTGDGANVGAVDMEALRVNLNIPTPTYEYSSRDLSQVFTAEELHDKIAAGDFSGITIGDYWPITLNGTYYNYQSKVDVTISDEVVKLELMPNFYAKFADAASAALPNHCLVCSRQCLTRMFALNKQASAWYDSAATNPFLGSYLYETLNNDENGLVKLVEQTDLGQYIYSGVNGKGMRFPWEDRASLETGSTGVTWGDRGKLFLPTEREVWGQAIYGESKYGGGGLLQWPVFAGGRMHIGKGYGESNTGNFNRWWTASAAAESSTLMCAVGDNGYPNAYSHNTSCGVLLCFIIV